MNTNGECRHWSINDGRECKGVVDLVGDVFVARTVDGKEVGRFKDLAAAAAAFDFNPEETT